MKSAKRGKTRKNEAAVNSSWDKRLLEPGWAGHLSDSEIEFIRQEMKLQRSLWRKWGYKEAMLKGVSIPASTIRRIAIHGLS